MKANEIVIKELSKLRKVGRDDLSYVRKVLTWPETILLHLIEVIMQYEPYQTTDAYGKKTVARLQSGEKLSLTRVMFNGLAACKPTFHYKSVLDGEMSVMVLLG